MLPHRFPFRLVDRRTEDAAVAALTLDAALWRGGDGSLPLSLAVELMAQAALLVLSRPPGEADQATAGELTGLLAGIETAELLMPILAGDRVEVRAELVRRLGALVMVRCAMTRSGETVATAGLLLAAGLPGPSSGR